MSHLCARRIDFGALVVRAKHMFEEIGSLLDFPTWWWALGSEDQMDGSDGSCRRVFVDIGDTERIERVNSRSTKAESL